MLVKLICPHCKLALEQQEAGWSCRSCPRVYPVRRGVVCFLEEEKSFNAGDFQEQNQDDWTASARQREQIRQSRLFSFLNELRIRFSLSGRRDRIFQSQMRSGSRERVILDLGCGGGRHYFANYGRVVGLDPVFNLLLIAQRMYQEVYQGSAAALPFADQTFDYVVSSDVIGHIPFEIKDAVFAEIFRVLKKGGRTIHMIETDSTNWWFRFAHAQPGFFQKCFVDRPGHISLELPTRLRQRFLKHGFKEITFQRTSTSIPECGTLAGIFDPPIRRQSLRMRWLGAADTLLARNLLVREMTNLLLEPVARVNDALRPLDDAGGALVVYER